MTTSSATHQGCVRSANDGEEGSGGWWQLDGYRLLASAPTGIVTLSLQGEGFEDVATRDRLLGDLDRGQEALNDRTVLVVDEAGMVGSRKLVASSGTPNTRTPR